MINMDQHHFSFCLQDIEGPKYDLSDQGPYDINSSTGDWSYQILDRVLTNYCIAADTTCRTILYSVQGTMLTPFF